VNPAAFPFTAKYDPEWIRDNALGENALCQVESLAHRLPLRAGMRVLDLSCGKATSTIFLAREFGIEVWAADGATSPTENRKRARTGLRRQDVSWKLHWEKTALVDVHCAELLHARGSGPLFERLGIRVALVQNPLALCSAQPTCLLRTVVRDEPCDQPYKAHRADHRERPTHPIALAIQAAAHRSLDPPESGEDESRS
jgi:hypothetical protein